MFYLQLNRQDDPSPTLWGHKFRVTGERCFFPSPNHRHRSTVLTNTEGASEATAELGREIQRNIIRRFFSQQHAKKCITPSKWKKNRRPLLRNRTSEVKRIVVLDQANRDALPFQ